MTDSSDPAFHAPQRLPVYQQAIGNVIDLIFTLEYDRIEMVSCQEVQLNHKKRRDKLRQLAQRRSCLSNR